MVKVAVKKRGRPAKKNPVGRPAKKKVGRPAKKKVKSIPESKGFVYDFARQEWIRPTTEPTVSLNYLNGLIAKLSVRVAAIEVKIEKAEQADAKIQSDLERLRETKKPEWKPRQPLDGRPASGNTKVKAMLRNGDIVGPNIVDFLVWSELGDRTIIAYALV